MKDENRGQRKENPGRDNENLVEAAVKMLIDENDLFVDYIRCNQCNLLESKKVDAIIVMRSSLALLVQIKSTKDGAQIHYIGKKDKGGFIKKEGCHHIIAIYPLRDETVEELSRRLLKIVNKILKSPTTGAYELHLNNQNEPLFL